MSRPITVLYFAWMRERVGVASESVDLPEGVETVSALVDYLSGRSESHASAFATRRSVRASVNQEMVDPSSPVRAGDEVGFFPPVTGG